MNTTHRSIRLSCATGMAVLGVLMAAGCSNEHRISLQEFLSMQAEQAQPAPTTQPQAQKALAKLIDQHLGAYKVGPGDILLVSLTGADAATVLAPFRVRVDRAGSAELPIVGKVKIAGMALEDAEQAIKNAFVPNVYRQAVVLVELATPDTTNVLVVGAVTQPGLVPLRRTERNMLYALVAAGGVSQLASGQATLRRIRRPTEIVTLDLTDPDQLKGALTIDPLQDGDIVYVHAAVPNMIYVGGLVNAPRPQIYPPGAQTSVLQAIAASGGLRTDLTPKEATLVRRRADGTDVHVKLNITRIARGEDPNITLAAGDILWVPHTCETRIQEFINQNFFFRAGVSVTYNLEGVEDYLHHDTGRNNRTLQDTFDPFGSLLQNAALSGLAGP